MPAVSPRHWTLDEVRALIDERQDRSVRYEYADGELLVTPAPGDFHQRIILELYDRIKPYVRSQKLGEVRLGPSAVALVPSTIFQPDLYVVPAVDGKRQRAGVPVTSALLVVEVLSPGSSHHDRVTKRRYYQQGGVGEYWIVDLESALLERWQPFDERPAIVDASFSWSPTGASEALTIDLPELLRAVADDDQP